MRIYVTKNESFLIDYSLYPNKTVYHAHGPEMHRQFEVIYLVDGEVKYFIGGEEYLGHTGDLIFVMPNEIHSLQKEENKKYERIVIWFDYDLLISMLDVGETAVDISLLNLSSNYRIIPDFIVKKYGINDIMMKFLKRNKGNEVQKSLNFFSSLFELVTVLNKVFTVENEMAVLPVSNEPLIQQTIDYINAHISEQIRLDDLSARLYVSKSTLCHRFSERMNISINRYITVKKICFAADLIKNGMSTTEASLAVGYENYTTFFHNYKQIMGTAPSSTKRN